MLWETAGTPRMSFLEQVSISTTSHWLSWPAWTVSRIRSRWDGVDHDVDRTFNWEPVAQNRCKKSHWICHASLNFPKRCSDFDFICKEVGFARFLTHRHHQNRFFCPIPLFFWAGSKWWFLGYISNKTNLWDFWSWYNPNHHFKGQTQPLGTLGCKTQVNILDCHYIKELKPLGFEAIFLSFSFIAMYSCQCVLLNKRKYFNISSKSHPSHLNEWFFHLMFAESLYLLNSMPYLSLGF